MNHPQPKPSILFYLCSIAEFFDLENQLSSVQHLFSKMDVLTEGSSKVRFNEMNDIDDLEYDILFVGFHSPSQQALVEKCLTQKKKTYLIGYYDSVELLEAHRTAECFLPHLDEVFVSCGLLGKDIQEKYPRLKVSVIGKSTLESCRYSGAISQSHLELSLKELKNDKHRTILYCGTYEDSYLDDLRLLLCCVEKWKELSQEAVTVWLKTHPAAHCDGSLEQVVLDREQVQGYHIFKQDFHTTQLLSHVDVLLTSTSFAAVEAAYSSKPSAYISHHYRNYFTDSKAIPLLRDPEAFIAFMQELDQWPQSLSTIRESVGLPTTALESFVRAIHLCVKKCTPAL